ncbi:hypothetical protein FQR65_LT00225 [Abscondita terminalis]|nr:hypothetical protein FQR65_LT00225 [Abscondita terminalis]
MSKRKEPSNSDNVNEDFCEFLNELAEYEKNVNRNVYKYNAYRKAASVLAAHPTRIVSGKEARALNGIGEKIAKKIDEFLETGKLKKLENIHKDESSTAINLLTRVTGIGPAKAHQLVQAGIKTLDDLRNNKHLLNHHQQIGLKHFEDFEKKIPRAEVGEIENLLKSHINAIDSNYGITICGSYRRGKSECGDIDVLLTHPNNPKDGLEAIVESLEKVGLVVERLSLGPTKFMGACRLQEYPVRRLDIRLTPYDQYHCSVLYFTGSDLFNKEMRAHALERGFTLNEYSLRPVGSTGVPGEPLEIKSERDIFEFIDFPYTPPMDRNK